MKKLSVVVLFVLPSLFVFTVSAHAASVEYTAHVQNIGWMDVKKDGQTAGTTGQGLRLEAIKIVGKSLPPGAHITYQAHVGGLNIGNPLGGPTGPAWMEWVRDGQIAGVTGQGRRIEALKIRLENAPGWRVEYRVHAADIGWMNWVKDGEVAGTTGQGRRVEAVEIRLALARIGTICVPKLNVITQISNDYLRQSVNAQAVAVNNYQLGIDIHNSVARNGFVECYYKSQHGDVSSLGYKYPCPEAQKEGGPGSYAHAYTCAK